MTNHKKTLQGALRHRGCILHMATPDTRTGEGRSMKRSAAVRKSEDRICLHEPAGRSEECIWMKKGVVNFHLCDNEGKCERCSFDRSMREFIACQSPVKGRHAEVPWSEQMRRGYPGFTRPCRYFLDGYLDSFSPCLRNYDCDGCPIDLALEYGPMVRAVEAFRKVWRSNHDA